MRIGNTIHLTYCTNIHPGESWAQVFDTLKTYLLPLKERLSPDADMGIGLRLSDLASRELIEPVELHAFKQWLETHHLYVFTMNGFPYGGFHGQVVKDNVYKPDWTTLERLEYTIRLARILAQLLPAGIEGGISTSPISYKPWFEGNKQAMNEAFEIGALHLTKVAEALTHLGIETGRSIHIDIEPEPDCLIENTTELIDFFQHKLLPIGSGYLMEKMAITSAVAEEVLLKRIQVCYDVCHFAVEYETPALVFDRLAQANINIGKIQISAALKAQLPHEKIAREAIARRFQSLAESTYLHQVIARNSDETFTFYPDLPQALPHIYEAQAEEWRTHFHVPVFVSDYENLQSTQDEIIEVLRLNQSRQLTQHLEVETYTWEVLPTSIKVDLYHSIAREMEWVKQQLS
ncbi:metabolite traffic protein EboE [Rhodocytophaga rosea]|uniref:Metabolite traffic protein EboE n=1 Tax=Rhodocytophaga rosea TaxID=2704465 RepID=A0A6C0GJE0_9BACT|nr:metabolite traffic protein EboE [Rhodocytophaga rosea]QHT67924.1 metabolite traffic protein EboE [Rhodocytophaga rosea]